MLNRPHVRNALNRSLRDGLLEGLALAAADASLTGVVLRGEGPSFCSGGDLDEFGTFTDPAAAHMVRLATSIGRAIAALGPRLVAQVHGPCAGSGVELPAFAARVCARTDFTAALPEIGLGLIPGAGGTASITRRVGRHRMALLALGGRADRRRHGVALGSGRRGDRRRLETAGPDGRRARSSPATPASTRP